MAAGLAALAVGAGLLAAPHAGSVTRPATPAGMRALPTAYRARAPLARAARAAASQTRYSLVHGCYTVRSSSGGAVGGDGPYRMQATGLGQYLLYGVHGDFLGAGLATAGAPSPSTVWTVLGSGRQGFRIVNQASGQALSVGFTPAAGCAVYPEGGVDATGTPFSGSSPEAQVLGTIDAHTHVTAFEFLGGDFHCGKPWDPYGIAYALPDCRPYEQGTNGLAEGFLDYGSPVHPHDTRGWPTFRAWPSPTDLAEEGDYYTGIKRAWMAGLRLMVTHLVDNEALCTLMTKRHNPCNDMAAVQIQARDLRALEDYIDAQSGGPGKGFFRIVTNPFQAREVINQGKLAVEEGIEVSHLFNCGEVLGVPQCTHAQIDAGLRQVRALGVSTFFPVHKFDNAFGGTKMDSGDIGLLVNVGNHYETGQFWDVKTCTGAEHDSQQLTLVPPPTLPGLPPLPGLPVSLLGGAVGTILNTPNPLVSPSTLLPVYPPPPHCNQRGLTALGAYLIDQMIRQHFIVQLDHMDAKTADAALSILEAHHYSGVVSAHSWDSPQENPRIYALGGFVTPIAGASPQSFIAQWRASLTMRDRRFFNGTGFGYGADMNGLADQSQPSAATPIHYPFTSYDGRVTFTREVWGQRVFDLNRDGVANYGMYPDWLAELQVLAGRPILADMFNGAEAYLEMWERADGVPASSCRPGTGRLSARGSGALRLGEGFEALLFGAGQPVSRPGSTYRYCVRGAAGTPLEAVFGGSARVAMVLATAPGYRAGALEVGARSARLSRLAAPRLAGAVWVARRSLAGGARYVYGVRRGRIRFVGVVARSALAPARLRGLLRAAGA